MVKIEDSNNRLTGCVEGCGIDGAILIKPITFLGSTVLSFNASLGLGPSQESTLSVELVNDCKVSGADDPNHFPTAEHFYGAAKLGGPVFFDTCESVCLPSGSSGCFHFGGILTNYTAQQGGGGLTFNAKVVDPRSLLEHAIVIVDSYLEGSIKHRNYFNAYAYYEYNILPTGLKKNYPVPTGLTLDPYRTDDVNPTIKGALGTDGEFFPAGNFDTSDCTVFGTADKNDRGMTGRKVLQALKNMKPLIYSPNYGEPYKPPLEGKDIIAAAGKFHHEFNVFELDMGGFPEPPPYYRVAGPSISILELLSNICDITGREFIVWLEKGDPGDPPIIKIETKKISENIDPTEIKNTIVDFNGRSTELSFGEELRVDKNRTILLGEQEHSLIESTDIQFYFGEDSDGNPITPVINTECGFEIVVEIDDLNALLNCPLFDPALHDNEDLSLEDKVLKRKVVISEVDIRTALSSNELWKARVGAANAKDSQIKTRYPTIDDQTIDFNEVIGYNFKDIITPLVSEIFASFGVGTASVDAAQRNGGFANSTKGMVDAAHSANSTYLKTLNDNRKKDLDSVYDFVHNIGKTYYGKQYLVALPTGVCSLPAGLYDENYFGIGSGTIADSYSGIYVPPHCSGEITDSAQLEGKIYRETLYSHIPTNAGGWIEPCTPALGLYEPELSFFKTEDFRVKPFARFDTKDVSITYTSSFIRRYDDNTIVGGIFNWLDEHGLTRPQEPVAKATTTVIKGVCGELDISQLSADDYLLIRESGAGGVCNLPADSGNVYPVFGSGFKISQTVASTGDIPMHLWLKADVDEKLYIISKCSGSPGTSPVPWQTDDPYGDCYWSDEGDPVGYCEEGTESTEGCDHVVKALIKFSDPCIKKPCNVDDSNLTDIFRAYAQAIDATSNMVDDDETKTIIQTDKTRARDEPSKTLCGIPKQSGTVTPRSSLDLSSINNKGYCGAADMPTAVCIPLRSNINAYGPWYSPNFETSSGGISFERDNDLAPWNYGSEIIMDNMAKGLVKEAQISLSEIETGSITHPGMPLLKLGFLDNGPNLTNVNVSFGGGGVTSNYTFQTYTPRFGALKNLQNQQLKESLKNRQRAQKIIKDRIIRENKIDRKLVRKGGSGSSAGDNTKDPLSKQSTMQRVLVGEMYDWSLIRDPQNISPTGGYNGQPRGIGQRTIVGTETLEKSALEMRFNYSGKAFMSWDGLLSPISISGDGDLPMFTIKYTGYPEASKSCSIAPIPPINIVESGKTGVLDIKINQQYLNPLTNNFGVSGHHHAGSGAGHSIDIVGRGTGVPGTGMIMNFYGQMDWQNRYTPDYRFLGLKGPLVLHAWGYDTQGKPIPNAIDDVEDIRESGLFANSGLKNEFLQDWLHKPATWPVAPIDLRFDRERGVWVSPPQHKIVVAQVKETISPYSSGSGVLVNEYNNKKYGQSIYDGSGNLIIASGDNSKAQINIVDRIGNTLSPGTKGYAYFDAFSSQYLMLGGMASAGSTIRLGTYNPAGGWSKLFRPYYVDDGQGGTIEKFMNIKKVKLFQASDREGAEPWELIAEENDDGTYKTVNVMNLFSYLPGYQSDSEKFCLIMKISDTGGQQDDPDNKEFWILIAAEC